MGKLITAFLSLCMVWWKKKVGVWVPLWAHKELAWHRDKWFKYWTEVLLYLQRTFAVRLTSLDHFTPWSSLSEQLSSSHISLLPLKAAFRLCVCLPPASHLYQTHLPAGRSIWGEEGWWGKWEASDGTPKICSWGRSNKSPLKAVGGQTGEQCQTYLSPDQGEDFLDPNLFPSAELGLEYLPRMELFNPICTESTKTRAWAHGGTLTLLQACPSERPWVRHLYEKHSTWKEVWARGGRRARVGEACSNQRPFPGPQGATCWAHCSPSPLPRCSTRVCPLKRASSGLLFFCLHRASNTLTHTCSPHPPTQLSVATKLGNHAHFSPENPCRALPAATSLTDVLLQHSLSFLHRGSLGKYFTPHAKLLVLPIGGDGITKFSLGHPRLWGADSWTLHGLSCWWVTFFFVCGKQFSLESG